ncbi:MAG: site-specific integrase [Akkermansiaceae bacterium]|nr:site-specific integrase [Akkermansiaceae bacterium]MDB4415415.1 site-specific integrase [Akkermansiaceae bacterium]
MSKTPQFSKSRIPCLVRHRGGNYYAAAKVNGRLIRRSLKTDDFNTAKLRLGDALGEMRGARNATSAGALGDAIYEEAHRNDPDIKESTQHYYQQISEALAKVGAKLPNDPLRQSISRVTVKELRELLDSYSSTTSPSRYNGALALLRRTYERAIEAKHVGENRAAGFKRRKPPKKMYNLPAAETFAAIVENILAQKKTHSKATAMSVQLLAFTGLRISEGQRLRWGDIKGDHLLVMTSKNDEPRQVPLIPAAKDLLERIKAAGISTRNHDPVMLIKSPRIALAGACERLGIDHLRVHDLRHIFATRCIEAGVDMPTLAQWLGHKDGGVLAAQVYGHLCDKHSTLMAGKVKA